MTTAARLTHRITLQEVTSQTRNAIGGMVETWGDVVTVWAAVEPLRGREYFAAQQVTSEITTRFRIRYRAGVTSKMRVLFKGSAYDIRSVINVDQKNVELQLMCVERGGQGGT